MSDVEVNVISGWDPWEVCRRVVAIKHCMMFHQIHDDVSVKEILDKCGVPSVQELAHQTQEMADYCLKSATTTAADIKRGNDGAS